MFALLIIFSHSKEHSIASRSRKLSLPQFGFLRGGSIHVELISETAEDFRFHMVPRDRYEIQIRNDSKYCTIKYGIIPRVRKEISSDFKYIEWYNQIEISCVYQPMIVVCSNVTSEYHVKYDIKNPTFDFDYRYLKSDTVFLIFDCRFICSAVLGISAWYLYPSFLIPIQLYTTLLAMLAAVSYDFNAYKYQKMIKENQFVSKKFELLNDSLLILTIVLSLIIGHLVSMGYSIIAKSIQYKTQLNVLITPIIIGVFIYLIQHGEDEVLNILSIIASSFPICYYLYNIINNVAYLLEASSEVTDNTMSLKISMTLKAISIWISSLVFCIISIPQEKGRNSIIFWSISLFIQIGCLSIYFVFSGGYVTEDEEEETVDNVIYIEDPNNDSRLMVLEP